MTEFIQLLKNKTTSFTFNVKHIRNINLWIENQLLENPAIACTINSYSYQVTHITSEVVRIFFNVKYDVLPQNTSVFLAKDNFDIQTALSVAFRLHQETVMLVVDNRTGFIPKNDYFKPIYENKEFVGEELQIHQLHSSSYSSRSFFNGNIIIYTVRFSYFNSAKELNDLSCLIAEQALDIRKACHNEVVPMLNSILRWFRRNIEYLNTDTTDDHSAVGLFKNKTAVCQGIAAYAYQLLSFCGIDARYVSGDGLGNDGWGPHGWNMVYINNRWVHIDYTFELNAFSVSIVKTEKEFKKKHRWDVERYSEAQSKLVLNAKKTFRHSLIVLLTEKSCYSINGCIIDATNDNKPCIVDDGKVFVAFLDILAIYGGAYYLENNVMSIYIATQKYIVPFSKFTLKNNTWYAPVTLLGSIGFRIQVEGNSVVIKNENE